MNIKILIRSMAILMLAVFLLASCEDRTELTAPASPSTGTADFSTFAVVGNSLTQGYQSGAVFESAQYYSYGNQIAKQVGTHFEQLIWGDPGSGGRMEVESLSPFTITYNNNMGIIQNITYSAPFNNLGVAGAFLYDFLNATDSNTCYTGVFAASPNPMFNVVLRGIGTQFQQLRMLQPKFVTFWFGNNDILGHATSGALVPFTPTLTFAGLYSMSMDSLATLGANVTVGNIPNVTAIPFFTTVGPQVALLMMDLINNQLLPPNAAIVYSKDFTNPLDLGTATPTELLQGKALLTLSGSSYAALLGQPTGAFYRENGLPIPPGVDTTKFFGFDPANPYPDALTLDEDELATIAAVIADYNQTIAALAGAKGFTVVDFNNFFNSVAANGNSSNGLQFSVQYMGDPDNDMLPLFSLDGVHPNSQGYAIIANKIIETVNSTFSANIPLVDVSEAPGSLVLHKGTNLNRIGLPDFKPGTFDHILF